MPRLEHVNLVVKDLSSTLEFIQTAFHDWKVRGSGKNEWFGKQRNWLHVGSDECYLTLNDGAEGANRDLKEHSPGLAHIGFCVDDIDGITSRLQTKGYEIDIVGADHPHRKTIYFIDREGFQFEFIEYFSEKPEDRNMYGGETSPVNYVGTDYQ